MLKHTLLSSLFALALSTAAAANAPADSLRPVFVEGGQYTAVLDQGRQAWRLLPADGVDLAVSAVEACEPGSRLPEGIWLLTRDAEGRPTLSAPSVTALPAGHPEQVALRACGDADGEGLFVAAPQGLIDWLGYNTGAIYVEN